MDQTDRQTTPLPLSESAVPSPGSWTRVCYPCLVCNGRCANKQRPRFGLPQLQQFFHVVVSMCPETLVPALQGFTRLAKKRPDSCQQNWCLRFPSLRSWGLCSCCATWGGFLTPVGFSASACLLLNCTISKPISILGSSMWKQRKNLNTPPFSSFIDEIIYFQGLRSRLWLYQRSNKYGFLLSCMFFFIAVFNEKESLTVVQICKAFSAGLCL